MILIFSIKIQIKLDTRKISTLICGSIHIVFISDEWKNFNLIKIGGMKSFRLKIYRRQKLAFKAMSENYWNFFSTQHLKLIFFVWFVDKTFYLQNQFSFQNFSFSNILKGPKIKKKKVSIFGENARKKKNFLYFQHFQVKR